MVRSGAQGLETGIAARGFLSLSSVLVKVLDRLLEYKEARDLEIKRAFVTQA